MLSLCTGILGFNLILVVNSDSAEIIHNSHLILLKRAYLWPKEDINVEDVEKGHLESAAAS